ncbi:hypothetical protein [Psychromonas sp. SP041]|uniref:hypothetical protein n=1 Tax=Psychromonas sp. SP041 TaxID=1365007 RepID=UPI000407D148|nr:hypothetical protein [Psychromonas sp. SP041]
MFFIKYALYLEVYDGKVKATELHSERSTESTCSGLTHPRTLMGDFFIVEQCFKKIVTELCPKKRLSTPPILYIHLLDINEGGYTNVECKAFTEAGLGAGGRLVKLIDGKNLMSKDQLLAGQFSELKGMLNK